MAAPADIAELQRALECCCADLAAALATAQAAAQQAPAADDGLDPLPADDGPKWRPLVLATIPGLETLLQIIEPPLKVIVALLQVIAALLQALAAILMGIPDIFRALIAAAIALLRDIINDLVNTGAYLYIDAPGIMPTEVDWKETGIVIDPIGDWKAGQQLKPPPVVPDGFARWATRFAASFDDPGDLKRPVITEGAPIQALFIVMAQPSLGALRQAIYLLGRLFNIDRFKVAFERYHASSSDPRRDRARKSKGVQPDWRSIRLRDILPLDGLLMLPETLRGLLMAVDNLSALIKNLATAIQDKAKLLLQLADAVKAIIDLLDALKSTGMYSLGLATQGGVAGLRQAFVAAGDRPPGGYVGGVCFLASGPNLAKAAMLFDLLGGTTAIELAEGKISLKEAVKQGAIGQAAAVLESATKPLPDAWGAFKSTAKDEANAFLDAVANAPASFYAEVGQSKDELVRAAKETRSLAVETISNSEVFVPDGSHIQSGIEHTQQAQRFGARSLALGFGGREPDSLLRDENSPPDDENTGGTKP